jgi:DNA-directed RNA polymerase specialized sigma24 family protein
MQALITTLMLVVALGFDGHTRPPTYGEVIEVMAAEAARLGDSRLTALVSDLSVQCLERGEWARSEGPGTLDRLGVRLRTRGRAAKRSRRQMAERKRAKRLRRRGRASAGGDGPAADRTREELPPIPHEVLHERPDAACDASVRGIEARDELARVGFDALPPTAQACLFATDVMGLRYRATAEALGLKSEDQVRQIRARALARMRRSGQALREHAN